MKHTFLIYVTIICGLTGTLNASLLPINIITEQYHIAGGYTCYVGNNVYADSYDIWSAEPISHSVSTQAQLPAIGLAYSSTKRFGLHISANHEAAGGGQATATALAAWSFRPQTELLQITLDWWGSLSGEDPDHGATITLMDLSTGEQIFEELFAHPLPQWYYPGSQTYLLPLNVTHDYGMVMSANTAASNGDGWYVDVELSAIPEPATLIMLLMATAVMRLKR